MATSRKLVLVDGTALIFRAYFAIPSTFTTTAGLRTNATYGFATMFRKLFAGRKPDLGVVVFDSGAKTFREEKFPGYKADRPEMAADLAVQLPWIDKVVDAHCFPRLRVDGYEADDVIGTLARLGAAEGLDVVIVSGDKDFAQLVDDRVRMVDTLRDITYDTELVQKKWGVKPSQIVDLLALMGDSVDGIPGVAGIGQKGATDLLAKYGSLEGVLAHVDELKGRQKTALEAGRESARLSYELATINRFVPLPVSLADLELREPEPAALNALYLELEFYSLLKDTPKSEARDSGPTIAHDIVADAKEVTARLDALAAAGGPMTIVPMIEEPTPVIGALAGLTFCGADARPFYVPFAGDGAHLGAGGVEQVRKWLEDPALPKVAHDSKQLWQVLSRRGIALAGVVGDTMLASYLLEPTKLVPHRLDQVVREYLHRTVPLRKALTGSGQKVRALAEIPVAETAAHAAQLAEAVHSLWPVLRAKLEDAGQSTHLAHHELPLARVLGRMELDGIRVDGAELARCGEEFARLRAIEEQKVHELAGRPFNIGSTKQLGEVLFEELKLPIQKRTKTGYGTDSEVLERLAEEHAIAKHVLEFRRYEKLINTYTDVLQAALNPTTGRVHATFQQTVGASGRIISTDPDLQRTPIRTPEGKRIRKAFVADRGCVLISADWSQIELRVLAHVSGDPNLVEAFHLNADVHRRTAGQLFRCDPSAVTPQQRNVGKTVNFATIYGQGATALGQILGIPRKEAQGYIEGYFATYQGVRAWLDRTIEEAHARGWVTTLLGRRRVIEELKSNNPTDRTAGERIAANTPIQGSAADLCKLAMLQIAERFAAAKLRTRLLLQIHDELVFEAPEAELDDARAIIRDVMEHAYPLSVPLVVEIGVGPTWADAH